MDPKWAEPYKRKDVNNANFFGMIANIDHNLGLLRDHLKDLNLDENTILIFMTDNGTSAGCKFPGLDTQPTLGFNAGMRGRKSSIYEGGHRCFLSSLAGRWLLQGRDIETLAAHIDVLPTLADLCKLPTPDKRYDLMDFLFLLCLQAKQIPGSAIICFYNIMEGLIINLNLVPLPTPS